MQIDKDTKVPFVLWYADGDRSQNPSIAISTMSRYDGCRNLVILGGNRHNWSIPGVMHIDDERLQNNPERRREDGAWDFCEDTKALHELKIQVSQLLESKKQPTSGSKAS